ncbi:hypothetical protein GGI15_003541 [Coemansia interrupta]|uniref:Uncharacterized protein n=1 Tax=Coemansia interrupta TaxID=1126814 RepID=A0A9W8H6X9_9FUNG|nr:hypothetical protein GGI15_003541 [Coemansia interrupta]
MHINESQHFSKAISADTALSPGECHEMYHQDPALLELREFIVSHAMGAQDDCTEDTPLRPRPAHLGCTPAGAKQSIPAVSLCTIANSLLEENRYEDGVRFLATLSTPVLAQNAMLVENLLRAFRPTAAIEGELKQRSTYLIQATGKAAGAPADYSALWTIDEERRESIVRAQGCVLGYLGTVGMRFLRPWFDRRFDAMADGFWDYAEELMAPPEAAPAVAEGGGKGRTDVLEHEMYANRVALVGLLLEQMCGDLAAHAAAPWRSVFMRIVAEGYAPGTSISYPKRLLAHISRCLQTASSHGQPPQPQKHEKEARVVRLLLEMLSAASALGVVARDNCVQELAKWAMDMTSADLRTTVDLVASDTLAVEVLGYLLLAWYRFVDPAEDEKKPGGPRRLLAGMPSGVGRTAGFLRCAMPPLKADTPGHFLFLVCVLSLLVQRTVGAFVRRMCRVNVSMGVQASRGFVTVMVSGREEGAVETLRGACRELVLRLQPVVDGKGAGAGGAVGSPRGRARRRSRAPGDGDRSSSDDDDAAIRAKIADELDLLTAFVESL